MMQGHPGGTMKRRYLACGGVQKWSVQPGTSQVLCSSTGFLILVYSDKKLPPELMKTQADLDLWCVGRVRYWGRGSITSSFAMNPHLVLAVDY
jgi:hypothetical protein